MGFNTAIQEDMTVGSSGEILQGHDSNTDVFDFEDGLRSGVICQFLNGKATNLDGTATPVIAGVPLRNMTGSMESADYKTAEHNKVDICNFGYITVELLAGANPTRFDKVYTLNNATADAGKITQDDSVTDVIEVEDTDFYKQLSPTVWVIRFKKVK